MKHTKMIQTLLETNSKLAGKVVNGFVRSGMIQYISSYNMPWFDADRFAYLMSYQSLLEATQSIEDTYKFLSMPEARALELNPTRVAATAKIVGKSAKEIEGEMVDAYTANLARDLETAERVKGLGLKHFTKLMGPLLEAQKVSPAPSSVDDPKLVASIVEKLQAEKATLLLASNQARTHKQAIKELVPIVRLLEMAA